MMLTYSLRTLTRRWPSTLPAVLATCVAVGVSAIILSFLEGMWTTLRQGATDNNVVLLEEGAGESDGELALEVVNHFKALSGPIFSPERLAMLTEKRVGGKPGWVRLRGVDPIALEAHPKVKLSAPLPQRGAPGVFVGRKLLGTFENMREGGTIVVRSQVWPVLGILDAPGTTYESEVWCDRQALVDEFKTGAASIAFAVLDSPEQVDQLKAEAARINAPKLEALRENELRDRQLAPLAIYWQVALVCVVLMGIGAVVASVNLLYAAFLERVREFAALLAIGFSRAQLSLVLVQEGFLIALLAAALGLGASLLFDGRTMVSGEAHLVFAAQLSPRVALACAGLAALIGFAGSTASVLHVLRLKVLGTLR
jgi:putative ABC transport system permease protein